MSLASDFFGGGSGGGVGIFPAFPPAGYWNNDIIGLAGTAYDGAILPYGYANDGDFIVIPDAAITPASRALGYYNAAGTSVWSYTTASIAGTAKWVSFMFDAVDSLLYVAYIDTATSGGVIRLFSVNSTGTVVYGVAGSSILASASNYWGGDSIGANSAPILSRAAQGSGDFTLKMNTHLVTFSGTTLDFVSKVNRFDATTLAARPIPGYPDVGWYINNPVPAGSAAYEHGQVVLEHTKDNGRVVYNTLTGFAQGVLGLPSTPNGSVLLEWGNDYYVVNPNWKTSVGFTRFSKTKTDDAIVDLIKTCGVIA